MDVAAVISEIMVLSYAYIQCFTKEIQVNASIGDSDNRNEMGNFHKEQEKKMFLMGDSSSLFSSCT